MVDDPNRDETPPVEPDDSARVTLPPTGSYVSPTRRQLRESEARAKAREKRSFRAPAPIASVTQPLPGAAVVAPETVEQPSPADHELAANELVTSNQAPSETPASDPVVSDSAPDEPSAFAQLDQPEFAWPMPQTPTPPTRQKRRRRRLIWLWVLIGLLVVAAGAATTVWVMYEDQVREVLGIELPNDYEGTGNGTAVNVTIVSGDVGSDIATKLEEAGVTMTYDAFYDLLLAKAEQPTFLPGTYELQEEMSAESALTVLADSTNIVTSRVLITEGSTLTQTLSALSEGTGLPLADFEAVAANYTSLGVPATAPNLEGWLFPATYDFEPGVTAQVILQTMADRMIQALDEAGVATDDRQRVLTLASIVQKEGGSVEDFPTVARLFLNRLELDPPMNLESDATVSYGTGNTSIHTTDEERADASNLYNTYANAGLPVGPISAPGDDAIAAVMNPAVGDWLFMVLVNGETGETTFSTTYAEHLVAVEEWQAWYNAHPDWDN